MGNKWIFDKIPRVSEKIFDARLEKFYKLGLDGLVRENIQNALDAKLKNTDEAVKVYINTGSMKSEAIPGFENIKKRILNLKEGNNCTKESISHMVEAIKKMDVPYLSFEDSNTRGLSGAEHGQDGSKKDTWSTYAYKKGEHFVEDDDRDENLRGGSHGVGKIASNSASDINLMYFANCDEIGNKHLGGTIQLMEHIIDNQAYRSTGYFSLEKIVDGRSILYPYKNNFDDVFEKNTRGLKIVIPFLREQYNDDNQLVRSVCDNFFIAIIKKRLIVEVNGLIIDSRTINGIVNNHEYYENTEADQIDKNFTPLYMNTHENFESEIITIKDKHTSYEFDFFFNYDAKIKSSRVAIIRQIGMKIEDKKIKGYVRKPFNGILMPKTEKEDIFLKTLENESHTSLSYDHIKDIGKQKNGKNFINNISKEIGKYVDEYMKENFPTDGAINTEDLLYSVESNFKQVLEKNSSTVMLNKNNKKNKKVVTKVVTKSRKNKKNTEDKIAKESENTKYRKKVDKKDGKEGSRKRVRYMMPSENVNRLLLNGNEILELDFSKNNSYKNEEKCDMSFSIIDGSGKEKSMEFNIIDNYREIKDEISGNKCCIENNIVKNISVINGKIKLKLATLSKYNESLKFIYYVEV